MTYKRKGIEDLKSTCLYKGLCYNEEKTRYVQLGMIENLLFLIEVRFMGDKIYEIKKC